MLKYKLELIFLACIIESINANRLPGNDESNEVDGKIINGVEIPISQAPHQVLLVINNIPYCGGSVIANCWILTAAHCLPRFTPLMLRVRIGSNDATFGGELIPAREIFTHPLYNNTTFDYDVGLVRLNKTMSQNISIPLAVSEVSFGVTAMVSGWGTTVVGGPMTRWLRVAQVTIIRRNVCNDSYNGEITIRMICAGGNGKDACQGDSGGPLYVNTGNAIMQVGITSWGRGCAENGFPGVYTNIANSEIRKFIRIFVGV